MGGWYSLWDISDEVSVVPCLEIMRKMKIAKQNLDERNDIAGNKMALARDVYVCYTLVEAWRMCRQ